MHYFSYGSNMSVKRLQKRVPSAKPLGAALLPGHQFKMHKVGRLDGTAKCDIVCTDNPTHCVFGVLYHIADNEKILLDEIEGLGNGYEEKQVQVELTDSSVKSLNTSRLVSAYTYYATDIDVQLRPLNWYLQHVLTGARENNLPESYIADIAAITADIDSDIARSASELSIYQQ